MRHPSLERPAIGAGRHLCRQSPSTPLRPGLSRAEAVVVLGVVGLLAANGLPAFQSAREVARRHQCTNNLRAIGTALHAYHDSYSYLPPACFWNDAELVMDSDDRPARNPDSVKSSRANWAQLLLPALGYIDLGREFRLDRTVTDPANEKPRTTPLAAMRCPSDQYNSTENPYVLRTADGAEFRFARGNYAINGGSQTNAEYPGRLTFPHPDGNVIVNRSPTSDFMWWGNGIAGFNRCFSFKDFTNGLTTTVAIDEIRAGIVPEDPRGAWALGQIGSSVTWAHGVNGDDYGPNNQLPDSDDILEGRAVESKYGMPPFTEARMPFCAHCNYSNQATARSQHPGGVNLLMADGSTRWIGDSIEPSLWHVMHSRETPADVFPADLDEAVARGGEENAPKEHGPQPPREANAADESRSAIPTPAATNREITNSIGMKMVAIPPGEFIMGLPDKDNSYTYPSSDAPRHSHNAAFLDGRL